jgi:hypothetical protein
VIRDVLSLDLFPTHVKIFDFEDDPDLNGALLTLARSDQSANSSLSGKSLLLRSEPWVGRLRAKLERALRAYLADLRSDRRDFAIEAYAFLNYHDGEAFTPVHDHLIEADLVCIYYAKIDPIARRGTSYYELDAGVLLLHDPRSDARVDHRSHARDHYLIYPAANQMVVHPAYLRHSVAAGAAGERLAVTCTVTINRDDLFEGYVRFAL